MEGGKSQFARYFSSRKDTAYTEDLAYLEVYGRCEVCAGSFIRERFRETNPSCLPSLYRKIILDAS